MVKIYREIYGCPANVADYEIALGLLKKAGFEFADDEKQSDINIIFTCTVKQPTLDRMIHRIKELTKLNKPLVVAGCMPKTEKEIIEGINPNASMLGPDSIEKIVYASIAAMRGNKAVLLEDSKRPKLCLPRERKNPVIGIITISSGCLSNCSYCSVRFARGNLFSYPVEMIVKEAKTSIEDGCKELYITSQDNSCYGKDIGKRLPELLNEICKIQGKFFVRVGMMNPLYTKEILDDLIKSYKNLEIFKFLHLPVQSFSSKILSLMKRDYQPEVVLDIINKFYEAFTDLTFSTDIIVGFPNEDNSDFEETIKFVEQIKPDIVNISKFGTRPGTEAAKLKQLPSHIVNKRSRELFELTRRVSFKKNQRWLNWSGECLIDEIGTRKDTWIGRNFTYKPIVVHSTQKLLGRFVNVEITEARSNYLIGRLI